MAMPKEQMTEIEDHLADTARRLTEERNRYAQEADALESEGLDAMAERLLAETNLRSMDFRNGMSMEIEPARALAANFVGAARAMLGEAENYSETPVEMKMKLGVDKDNPATWEKFAFIVQRVAPGKLTPHEARRQAEAERDRLAEQLDPQRLHAVIEAALIAYWCLDRGKDKPDRLGLAEAASHAFVLVDALRHAGLPIDREETADAHGVREAVTRAIRALDGEPAGEEDGDA